MIMTSVPSDRATASPSEWTMSQPSARKEASRVTTTFCRPGKALPIDCQVRRPMTIGLPMVISLKCLSSRGRCQGKTPSSPMARLRPMAATRVMSLPCSIGGRVRPR